MELSKEPNITFEALQTRLIRFVNARIRNGDFTERGLARILGVSQPQIHNVLKGARKLHPDLADRLFRKFDMDLLDLLDASEIYQALLARGTVNLEIAGGLIGAHIPPKRFSAAELLPKPVRQPRRSSAAAAKAG